MTRNDHLYTLENAQRHRWASITGELNPERLGFLRSYLVGKRVLDVGCGGGGYVEELCREGYRAVGLDKTQEFLHFAMEREDKLGEYVQGDIVRLPFEDKSFDTVFCFDVLEHVDDVAAVLELTRVAGRSMVVAVPLEDDQLTRLGVTLVHYRDKTHLREYTEKTLRKLIVDNVTNIERLEIVPEGKLNFPWIISQLLRSVDQTNTAIQSMQRRVVAKLASSARFPEIFSGLLAGILFRNEDRGLA